MSVGGRPAPGSEEGWTALSLEDLVTAGANVRMKKSHLKGSRGTHPLPLPTVCETPWDMHMGHSQNGHHKCLAGAFILVKLTQLSFRGIIFKNKFLQMIWKVGPRVVLRSIAPGDVSIVSRPQTLVFLHLLHTYGCCPTCWK